VIIERAKAVNDALLADSAGFLESEFPDGVLRGREYRLGNVQGDPGTSLCINVETGEWFDHSTMEGGQSFIDLYAAKYGIAFADAVVALEARENGGKRFSVKRDDYVITPPPANAPPFIPDREASESWEYRTDSGPLFYVVRYDSKEGKSFRQFSWDSKSCRWAPKAWTGQKPLYRQPVISRTTKPVLVVEGERTADKAQKLLGSMFEVTTWAGGASAVAKTDWDPLCGKDVVVWPDNDAPGKKAAKTIEKIIEKAASSVRVVPVNTLGFPEAWDLGNAYDADIPRDKILDMIRGTKVEVKVEVQATADKSEDVGSEVRLFTWASMGIQVSKSGTISKDYATVKKVFTARQDLVADFYYSDFTGQIMKGDRPIEDHHVKELSEILQNKIGIGSIKDQVVFGGLELFCRESKNKNPVKEFIDSTKWDGVPRCDSFFSTVTRRQPTNYMSDVSRIFWLGLTSRALKPGCKFDFFIILEGRQGICKSWLLAHVADPWFKNLHADFGSKDFYIGLSGTILCEVPELDSFSRADHATVKAELSKSHDSYRPPYGRNNVEKPRTCIFVGTTNDMHYLVDMSGNRRFLPVNLGSSAINLEYVKEFRGQLFAEAAERVRSGEEFWQRPESADSECQKRMKPDPMLEPIRLYTNKNPTGGSVSSIYASLDLPPGRVLPGQVKRIYDILSILGWTTEGDQAFPNPQEEFDYDTKRED